MWPNNGPPRQLVLTAGVRRSAEDSVADEGKYLRPTCPAALCMTSLNDHQLSIPPACESVNTAVTRGDAVERVTRIELAWPAWKAGALPLSYTRVAVMIFRRQRR
jgi:hypothetical protein